MSKLGVVEDTLFVPMLGRIYASEHCPQILYDPEGAGAEKEAAVQPCRSRTDRASILCWPPPPGPPIWIGTSGRFWSAGRTV